MKRAYLDTAVWVTRAEGLPAYSNLVRKELQTLQENGWQLCLSDLVVLEVLIKPLRENRHDLVAGYHKVFSESIRLSNFNDAFDNALLCAQKEGVKALDAIHLAFAINYECDLFVTTDQDFRTLNSLSLHWIDLSQTVLK